MGQDLRILILEDRKEDSKLIDRELRNGGLTFNALTVETEEAFAKGIEEFNPHLILADYRLPSFDGMTALSVSKKKCPEIPFIFVSGTIGEDRAIETLKQGATDYVLKSRLSRLAPVVKRALKEAEALALQRDAEEAISESERHYRFLFDNMLNGYAHCRMLFDQGRPKDFIYLSVNNAFETLTGLRDVVGKKISEVIPGIQASNPELFEIYGRVSLSGIPERVETFVESLGMWFSISVHSAQKEYFVALFDGITERKRSEQALRESLEEKEALLNEVHHRVKNNLQIVASLLSLQTSRVKNSDVVDVLKDTRNRVRSMALLHETLYRSGNLARMNFASYVSELCGRLLRSFGPLADRVKIQKRIEEIGMSLEQALPCGLIINELVSNALKHGFSGERSGKVTVEFNWGEDKKLALRVSDDGVGLPPDFDLNTTSTLGLKLVSKLTGQLEGNFTVRTEEGLGSAFCVVFPASSAIRPGGES